MKIEEPPRGPSGESALVMNALRRIVRQLRLSASAAAHHSRLSSAQLFVLHRLLEAPAPSMGQLAERTLTDQSSVSVVVAKLVERGLVVRRASNGDRRRAEIALTANGRRVVLRAPEPAQTRLVAALDRLAPAMRRALATGLSALLSEMGIANEEPALFFEEQHAPPSPGAAARVSPPNRRALRSRDGSAGANDKPRGARK